MVLMTKAFQTMHISHTFFGVVKGEDLIMNLDEYGIAASTRSACPVKKQKPSHVLKAMGSSNEEITGSLRLSMGIEILRRKLIKLFAVCQI
jgi:cysteine desulfurase